MRKNNLAKLCVIFLGLAMPPLAHAEAPLSASPATPLVAVVPFGNNTQEEGTVDDLTTQTELKYLFDANKLSGFYGQTPTTAQNYSGAATPTATFQHTAPENSAAHFANINPTGGEMENNTLHSFSQTDSAGYDFTVPQMAGNNSPAKPVELNSGFNKTLNHVNGTNLQEGINSNSHASDIINQFNY